MKKGIGLILTVALIMAIAVVMVACNTGSSNKPSNDTGSDTSTTIAVDYSASAIAQNIETLSSAGFKVRYEITEGGVTHNVQFAMQGGKFYYSADSEEAYLDLSDSSVGGVIYSKVDGEWQKQEIPYDATIWAQLKQQAMSIVNYMRVYDSFGSFKVAKSSVTIAGRLCDRYVLADSALGSGVTLDVSIDRATGIALKWNMTGISADGVAAASFECKEFVTGYTIELPTVQEHVHNLVKVDEVPATEKADGHLAYWTCSCGKVFADANGQQEIADLAAWLADENGGLLPATGEPVHEHSLTKVDEVPATAAEDGHKAYWTCECGKEFADDQGEQEIGNLQVWLQNDGRLAATGYDFNISFYVDGELVRTNSFNAPAGTAYAEIVGYAANLFKAAYPSYDYEQAFDFEVQGVEEPSVIAGANPISIRFTTVQQQHEHSFGEWHDVTPATCTAAGTQSRECACGESETRTTEALGHSWSAWTTSKPASCGQAGEETRTCSRCQATETRATEALSHDWSAWTTSKPATCTEAGEQTRTCSRCQATETRATSMLDHEIVKVNEVAATENSDGHKGYWTCSNCGKAFLNYSATEPIEDLDAWLVDPDGGLILFTYSFSVRFYLDGESYDSNRFTGTRLSTYDQLVSTAVQMFTQLLHPDVELDLQAGFAYEVEGIEKPGNIAGSNTINVFLSTAQPAVHEHSFGEWTVSTPATCEQGGVETRTCACGASETRETEALGHDWGFADSIKEPTCTQSGEYAHTCQRCGVTEHITTDPRGHGMLMKEGREATAEYDGLREYYYCSTCKKYFADAEGTQEIADLNTWKLSVNGGLILHEYQFTVNVYVDDVPIYINDFKATRAKTYAQLAAAAVADAKQRNPEYSVQDEYTFTVDNVDNPGYVLSNNALRIYLQSPPCEHVWGEWQTIDPAFCLSNGSKIRYCTLCGQSQMGTIDALGHDWSDWTVLHEATCTEAGDKVRTCSRCQEEELVAIAKLDHDWSEWSPSKEATCTSPAEENRTCSRCRRKETRVVGEALGHNLNKIDEVAANETEAGHLAFWQCTRCQAYFADAAATQPIANINTWLAEGGAGYLPATGHVHSFGDWSVTTEATCDQTGLKTRTCACGEAETEVIPAKGHSWGNWQNIQDQTCTQDGIQTRECSRCHETERRTLEAPGHALNHQDGADPECERPGHKEFWTCSNCGLYFADQAATQQFDDFSAWADDPDGAGYIPALGHDLHEVPGYAATETTDGRKSYWHCDRCERNYADAQATDWIRTLETWLQNEGVIPALGEQHQHNFGEWTVSIPATCTEVGEERRECACGEVERREIAALGHDIHQYEGQAATCEQAGWQAYEACSRCNYTTYQAIPALGHDLGSWYTVTPATCTEGGVERRDCGRQGCDYYETREIAALGHDWSEWSPSKEATCTAPAEQMRTCMTCREKETRVVGDPLGHHVIHVEAEPATCATDGHQEYWVCDRCWTYATDADLAHPIEDLEAWLAGEGRFAAPGHDIVHVEAHEATCTEAGTKAYWQCSNCGSKWSDEDCTDSIVNGFDIWVVIPALGHDWGEWVASQDGTSETRTCSRCQTTETREVNPNLVQIGAQYDSFEDLLQDLVAWVSAESGCHVLYNIAQSGDGMTMEGVLIFDADNGKLYMAEGDPDTDAAYLDMTDPSAPVQYALTNGVWLRQALPYEMSVENAVYGVAHTLFAQQAMFGNIYAIHSVVEYFDCTCDRFEYVDGDASLVLIVDQETSICLYMDAHNMGLGADVMTMAIAELAFEGSVTLPTDIHTHTLVEVPQVDATAEADGHRAYWYCEGCNMYFADANGNNVIRDINNWLMYEGCLKFDSARVDAEAWAAAFDLGNFTVGIRSNKGELNMYLLTNDHVVYVNMENMSIIIHDLANDQYTSYFFSSDSGWQSQTIPQEQAVMYAAAFQSIGWIPDLSAVFDQFEYDEGRGAYVFYAKDEPLTLNTFVLGNFGYPSFECSYAEVSFNNGALSRIIIQDGEKNRFEFNLSYEEQEVYVPEIVQTVFEYVGDNAQRVTLYTLSGRFTFDTNDGTIQGYYQEIDGTYYLVNNFTTYVIELDEENASFELVDTLTFDNGSDSLEYNRFIDAQGRICLKPTSLILEGTGTFYREIRVDGQTFTCNGTYTIDEENGCYLCYVFGDAESNYGTFNLYLVEAVAPMPLLSFTPATTYQVPVSFELNGEVVDTITFEVNNWTRYQDLINTALSAFESRHPDVDVSVDGYGIDGVDKAEYVVGNNAVTIYLATITLRSILVDSWDDNVALGSTWQDVIKSVCAYDDRGARHELSLEDCTIDALEEYTEAGEYTINISYGALTASVTFRVYDPDNIQSLGYEANIDAYCLYEYYIFARYSNPADLIYVYEVFDNGERQPVKDDVTISLDTTNLGDKQGTISVGEEVIRTFNAYVIDLSGASIAELKAGVENYQVDKSDSLSLADLGLKVRARYYEDAFGALIEDPIFTAVAEAKWLYEEVRILSNNYYFTLADGMYSVNGWSTDVGYHKMTVTVGDWTQPVEYFVFDAYAIQWIELNIFNERIAKDSTIDALGLVVTAHYANGEQGELDPSDYTSDFNSSEAGFGRTLQVNVAIEGYEHVSNTIDYYIYDPDNLVQVDYGPEFNGYLPLGATLEDFAPQFYRLYDSGHKNYYPVTLEGEFDAATTGKKEIVIIYVDEVTQEEFRFAVEYQVYDPEHLEVITFNVWIEGQGARVPLGESIEQLGLHLDLLYDNGEWEYLFGTQLGVQDFDSSSLGYHTLTVSYAGQTRSVEYFVFDPNEPIVDWLMYLTYGDGSSMVPIGTDVEKIILGIAFRYLDGEVVRIYAEDNNGIYEIVGFDSSVAGSRTLYIRAQGYTREFQYTIFDPATVVIASVDIEFGEFIMGETPQITSLNGALYDDQGRMILMQNVSADDWSLTGFDTTVAGEFTATLTVYGYTFDLPYKVVDDPYVCCVPMYENEEDADYSFDLSAHNYYISLNRAPTMTSERYSLDTLVNRYGYGDPDLYNQLGKQANELGYILVTSDNYGSVITLLDQALQAFGLSMYEDGQLKEDWLKEWCFYNPNEEPHEPQEPLWSGELTIDLSAITWFGNEDCVPYLYVWYADGSTNGTYPGVEIYGEGGIYNVSLDAYKQVSGLIVVRVSADRTKMYNKTGDMTLPYEGNTIKVYELSEIPQDQQDMPAGPVVSSIAEDFEGIGTDEWVLDLWNNGAHVSFAIAEGLSRTVTMVDGIQQILMGPLTTILDVREQDSFVMYVFDNGTWTATRYTYPYTDNPMMLGGNLHDKDEMMRLLLQATLMSVLPISNDLNTSFNRVQTVYKDRECYVYSDDSISITIDIETGVALLIEGRQDFCLDQFAFGEDVSITLPDVEIIDYQPAEPDEPQEPDNPEVPQISAYVMFGDAQIEMDVETVQDPEVGEYTQYAAYEVFVPAEYLNEVRVFVVIDAEEIELMLEEGSFECGAGYYEFFAGEFEGEYYAFCNYAGPEMTESYLAGRLYFFEVTGLWLPILADLEAECQDDNTFDIIDGDALDVGIYWELYNYFNNGAQTHTWELVSKGDYVTRFVGEERWVEIAWDGEHECVNVSSGLNEQPEEPEEKDVYLSLSNLNYDLTFDLVESELYEGLVYQLAVEIVVEDEEEGVDIEIYDNKGQTYTNYHEGFEGHIYESGTYTFTIVVNQSNLIIVTMQPAEPQISAYVMVGEERIDMRLEYEELPEGGEAVYFAAWEVYVSAEALNDVHVFVVIDDGEPVELELEEALEEEGNYEFFVYPEDDGYFAMFNFDQPDAPLQPDDPEEPQEPTTRTISAQITWEWFGTADAYLYVWYTDGNNNGWPGVKMQYDEESGLWSAEVDSAKEIAGVIVCRCSAPDEEGRITTWNKSGDITEISEDGIIVVSMMYDAN